ncbi:MAG: DUF3108 domain-containing protein [Elusimicrobiaceae bacterium]|nr:DUF3108 domain-containing protein [Elusimicrobiaceae bacterium]
MTKCQAVLFSVVFLLAACHAAKSSPSDLNSLPLATSPTQETANKAEKTQPSDATIADIEPKDIESKKEEMPLLDKPVVSQKQPSVEKEPAIIQEQTFTLPNTVATDRAVFEDEELIDFSDRSLHPYAGLVPDVNAPQKAPWAYEQLKYGIYYTFVKAGTAYIRNRGLVSLNGRPTYLIQTTAFSAPVIDAVFKVRDINQSWLDAQGLYSVGYGQSVREGRYIRDEWITFDYENHQYIGQSKKKSQPKQIQGPLDIKVLDMLTSLYYVRSQDLKVGKDLVFDIVNRNKQYPLLVKVLKKEKVKTKAGTFNTIVVEPQIRGEGIFVSKGKSLKVWLTDDKYKMPVKMTVEVFIGSVAAELLEYKRQSPENIL